MSRKGWSQHDLAEAAGVRQATISRIVTGKNPHPGTVSRLAESLGVSTAWLATGEEMPYDFRAETMKMLDGKISELVSQRIPEPAPMRSLDEAPQRAAGAPSIADQFGQLARSISAEISGLTQQIEELMEQRQYYLSELGTAHVRYASLEERHSRLEEECARLEAQAGAAEQGHARRRPRAS